MPPPFAALTCIIFIYILLRFDFKGSKKYSNQLWVPFIWMFIAGSRFPSTWLNMRPPTSSSLSEGSPLDRMFFLTMIIIGIYLLIKNNIKWNEIIKNNLILFIYYLYCLLSVIWSDDPFVALKRWLKDLGNPIMALVILTNNSPYEGLETLIRRLAIIMMPLSILFIKYYPELGRTYHVNGSPLYTGVGSQKNDLGSLCLMAGIFFSWNLIFKHKNEANAYIKYIYYILGIILIWLLSMSDSKTSLVCLLSIITLFKIFKLPFIQKKPSKIILIVFLAIGVMCFVDLVFDLKANFLQLLGRRPDLTDRARIWEICNSMVTNPVIGTGFQSFWLGQRVEVLWARIGVQINQAHNGYLEQYFNLGYTGIIFILFILINGIYRVSSQLNVNPHISILRFALIFNSIIYNYTEASFYGINNIWLLLLISIIEIPLKKNVNKSVEMTKNKIILNTNKLPGHRYKKY